MNQKNLGDEATRQKIIGPDLLDKNIFLSAGAGSGKTSSLVNRVMALIGNGVPVASIVAITFTREAAKMFYGRMTAELELMMARSKEPEEREIYRVAFEEIDNAFFGTIDSFCRKLLLEHPAEAKITSQLSPLEKPGDKRKIVDHGLKLLLKDKSPAAVYDHYQELWKWDFYGEEFAQLLMYVLEEDIFDLELGEEPEETRNPQILAYLEDIQGVGLDLKEEYEKRVILGNSIEQSRGLVTQKSIGDYERALRFIDKEHPANRVKFLQNMVQAFTYRQSKEKAERPELIIERAEELLENPMANQIISEYQETRYYKALNWAMEMRDSLFILGEEEGLISYNRSLKRLVQMLERDQSTGGQLLDYLREKYRYYLIDELQDTNQLQSRLFGLLAGEHLGALFVVGDEKQAIYRFRGGDVDNFRRLEESMMIAEDETVLQLTCNFRSSEPLRQWFNNKFKEEEFFGEEFPLIEEAEKQSLYKALADKVIDGVYTYPVIKEKGAKIQTDERIQVLGIIRKILGKPVSHYDHKSKTMNIHYLKYDDILVLTYKKKELNEYMAIFKDNGIPYSVVGSSNLQSSKTLAMMGRVLDYIAHPEDAYKECACLLEEPFSISEKELYSYKRGRTTPEVEKAKGFIETLSSELEGKTPSAMYFHIMGKMKLIYMGSVFNIEDASDTLYYGLELVREGEHEGKIRNLKDLGEFIRGDLLAGGYEYELSMSGKTKGVRLMNLHKAKGLESKVVILADAVASRGGGGTEKQYDYGNNSIKIFNVPKRSLEGGSRGDVVFTDKFADEMKEEKQKLAEEGMRLNYVAATRAENILVIPTLYKDGRDKNQTPLPPVAGEVLEGKWHSLLTDDLKNILELNIDHLNGVVTKESEDQEILEGDIIREFELPCLQRNESYETINPSGVELRVNVLADRQEMTQPELVEENSDGISDSDNEWRMSLAKWQREGSIVGTLVHALMEALVQRLPEVINEIECKILIENLIKFYEIPEEDKDFFASTLWGVFNNMVSGGYSQEWADESLRFPQDLLKELASAQEIYTELPFSIYGGKEGPLIKSLILELNLQEGKDGYINGIMDLVYKKNGEYFIIDYKTNFSAQDLWQHYEAQIYLYKKVLKDCFSLDEEPRAYLYHIPARDESSLPKRGDLEVKL